jgi:argininosuccinate synthase
VIPGAPAPSSNGWKHCRSRDLIQYKRIALAYSGSLASSAAIAWLVDRHHAEVVAVIVDVGQMDDLEEVRARALTAGAVRAHVLDRRDVVAHECAIPLVQSGTEITAGAVIDLADDVVAHAVVELARIEGADAVAHASADAAYDARIAQFDPRLPVIAPAREWNMDAAALDAFARSRHLPFGVPRHERNLLIRPVAAAVRHRDQSARVAIAFERAMPVSVNGVAMALQELIESLSLLGGQYGVGAAPISSPAAILLQTAYRAAAGADAVVTLTLQDGTHAVVGADEACRALVNHS